MRTLKGAKGRVKKTNNDVGISKTVITERTTPGINKQYTPVQPSTSSAAELAIDSYHDSGAAARAFRAFGLLCEGDADLRNVTEGLRRCSPEALRGTISWFWRFLYK